MYSNVKIIRSKRKTSAIEISKDAQIILRLPLGATDEYAMRLLSEKSDWITHHIELSRERAKNAMPVFTTSELEDLVTHAKNILPPIVEYYAKLVGVNYNRITVRKQTSRWGSCSAKGNLNFNCLVTLCPDDVRDYVIVHELCHRKQMNHSPRFWNEVAKIMPDYQNSRRWLKVYGSQLIARIKYDN